ncbi:hypothetical protein E2562_018814 [Oryza meyeriana var. granulata]|uniref:Uncharacterized protein n=1 Tax=Oryza meyeriana var. granulata TaxID=110450 RepID=A0A6G1F9H4_9ORYZ|nr:hypothetical protein E2562_018814 [Oryza meyeriana var. granulata]
MGYDGGEKSGINFNGIDPWSCKDSTETSVLGGLSFKGRLSKDESDTSSFKGESDLSFAEADPLFVENEVEKKEQGQKVEWKGKCRN